MSAPQRQKIPARHNYPDILGKFAQRPKAQTAVTNRNFAGKFNSGT